MGRKLVRRSDLVISTAELLFQRTKFAAEGVQIGAQVQDHLMEGLDGAVLEGQAGFEFHKSVVVVHEGGQDNPFASAKPGGTNASSLVDMDITINTPALFFPAISLLMLAYTNRFLGLASIIRNLHAKWTTSPDPIYVEQIRNLRRRLRLIRDMQTLGILSLFLCVVCMFLLFRGYIQAANIVFGTSLVLMLCSLAVSIWEIQLSGGALNLHLRDMESGQKRAG